MDIGPFLGGGIAFQGLTHLLHVPSNGWKNRSSPKVIGKMEFDFYRWEMFPAVSIWKALTRNSTNLLVICAPPTLQRDWR